MGSTVVALYSQNENYEVAWVGDSRAYLWTHTADGGRLEQLSTDHSYVQMLLESGAITFEELENHPEKNIITQCIGSQELVDVRVDVVRGQWQRDQWILLCSDGLTDEVSDKTIAQVLCDANNSEVAVDQLLHAALTNGGHDNITLQIIESPLQPRHPLVSIWQWVPYLTGRRPWDALIYGAAVFALLALLYSIIK
jgi:protein phosphatase